jgi:phage shock protein PspC (stress-responsive transcriptional regulator)
VDFDRDTVGIVLAGVFAGLAVLLAIVALARQPFLLVLAVPFGLAAYLVFMGATGRAPLGGYRRVTPEEAREARATRGDREPGGRSRFAEAARQRAAGERSRAGPSRARASTQRGRQSTQANNTLARRDAARILGIDADAEPAAVRRAYRERVKTVHPDADGGDQETFQQVNEAYERLREK